MTTTSPRPAPPTTDAGGSTTVLVVLLAAGVSFALSQTLVLPALSVLGREYAASPTATSWVVTGFLLSASVATPIVGKLGDVYGKGRVLTGVLAVFALGGLVNALSGSIELLVAGRVLQGVAGGVFPLAFGIVRDTFPRDRVPGAISLISSVFGVGAGIGLPLSGVIVDHLDVSVVFWLSLVAAPAALAAYTLIPATPTVPGMRIDWTGALLLSGALALLLLGVTQAPSLGWGSPGNVGLLLGGAALLAAWVVVERRVAQPLIELGVLTQPAVAATNLTGLLTGLAMFSGFLLIPQIAQAPEATGYGLGASVTVAGLLLAPSAVGQLVAGPLAGRLGVRAGFRTTLVLGSLLSTSAFVLLALLHDAAWHLALGGLLLGARDRVRLRLDGQPHRRGGAAERGGHRDRHQHRHAHDRRRVRLRAVDGGARQHGHRGGGAQRRRLHRGVRRRSGDGAARDRLGPSAAARLTACSVLDGAQSSTAAQSSTGSSTSTGISRSVLVWYSAYGGNAATERSHQAARSCPCTSRATMSRLTGPSCSSTCGWASRFAYQTGCSGAPPLDAIAAYRPSCSTRMTGVLRSLPLRAPRLVMITTGSPVSRRVVPCVPPEDS